MLKARILFIKFSKKFPRAHLSLHGVNNWANPQGQNQKSRMVREWPKIVRRKESSAGQSSMR